MPKLINWELIKNPYNWIIVYLMVTIFAFGWGLVDPLKVNDTQGSPP
jgi:hypothetical protein